MITKFKIFENIEIKIGGYYLANYRGNVLSVPVKVKIVSLIEGEYDGKKWYDPDHYKAYFLDTRRKLHFTPSYSPILKDDIIRELNPDEIDEIESIIMAKKYNL